MQTLLFAINILKLKLLQTWINAHDYCCSIGMKLPHWPTMALFQDAYDGLKYRKNIFLRYNCAGELVIILFQHPWFTSTLTRPMQMETALTAGVSRICQFHWNCMRQLIMSFQFVKVRLALSPPSNPLFLFPSMLVRNDSPGVLQCSKRDVIPPATSYMLICMPK